MHSRRVVIDLLRARGTLSRSDLAAETRLSKPTISAIIAQLIAEGIVQVTGAGQSTGGRKPILVRLGGDRKVLAGVEVGAKCCTFVLLSLDGTVLAQRERQVDDTEVQAVVTLIVEEMTTFFTTRSWDALIGCGVAVAGVVDPVSDTVRAAGLGWDDAPLRTLLAARLGVPVMVTDRGKAAALGELWARGGTPRDAVVYLYLGEGVGGALVLGGALYNGKDHTAGEIGHMSVDGNGLRCVCGNRGCLEMYVSSAAIIARAEGRCGVTGIMTLSASAPITVESLGIAARAGNVAAQTVIAETARYLGIAVANLVNILNPEAVVLSGPTTQWGDLLLDAVRTEVAGRGLAIPLRTVHILQGQAGATAVSLGAAALIREQVGELLAYPRNLSKDVTEHGADTIDTVWHDVVHV